MLSYRRKYATVVLIVLVGFVLMFLIKISVVLNSQTTTATVSKDNHVIHNKIKPSSLMMVTKDSMEPLCRETNEIVRIVQNMALTSNNTNDAIPWLQKGPYIYLDCEQLMRSLPRFHDKVEHGNVLPNSEMLSTTNSTNVHVNLLEHNMTALESSNNQTEILSKGTPEITFELRHTLSLQRLSEKLRLLNDSKRKNTAKHTTNLDQHSPHLTIVVIGGSMTTGYVDNSKLGHVQTFDRAWPKKLELFMRQKWPNSSIQVVNLAMGGANEVTWLGRIDMVMEYTPDIILVESAINDECDYVEQEQKAKFVNETSYTLLNLLMNFPTEPAVINVELFRLAQNNFRDANRHCSGHIKDSMADLLDNDKKCLYCPQWWMPQDWRQNAREMNSVSHVSYRDAVWPNIDVPPINLCEYWSGLSHPEAGVHAMVASSLMFYFMVVMHKEQELSRLSQSEVPDGKGNNEAQFKLPPPEVPDNVCLSHISSFRAMQGDSNDPFLSDYLTDGWNHDLNSSSYKAMNSCWEFRTDVRDKFGWICENNYTSVISEDQDDVLDLKDGDFFHLFKRVHIGGNKRVILSRLVSYDERMSQAQVWFSSATNTLPLQSYSNIFVGDPTWNITSWHKEKYSIPQPHTILLSDMHFKVESKIEKWPERNDEYLEVILNLKLLPGTSSSNKIETNAENGTQKIFHVDKFKLLGLVTC